MTPEQRLEENEAAYRRLKPMIDRTYPKGQFVAVADGRVIADAATFDELYQTLLAAGTNPHEIIGVQVGIDDEIYGDILGSTFWPEREPQA